MDYVLVESGEYANDFLHIDCLVYCRDIDECVYYDDGTYIEDEHEYVFETDGYHQHNDGLWYSYEEEEDDEE